MNRKTSQSQSAENEGNQGARADNGNSARKTRSQSGKGKSKVVSYSEEETAEEVTLEGLQKSLEDINLKIEEGNRKIENNTNQKFDEVLVGLSEIQGSTSKPHDFPGPQLPSALFNSKRTSIRLIVDTLMDGSNAVNVLALCSQPDLRTSPQVVISLLENAFKSISGAAASRPSTSASPSTSKPATASQAVEQPQLSPSSSRSQPNSYSKASSSPSSLVGWTGDQFAGLESTPSQSSFNSQTPESSTGSVSSEAAFFEMRAQTVREIEQASKAGSLDEMSGDKRAEVLKETLIREMTGFKIQMANLTQSERAALARLEEEVKKRRVLEARAADNSNLVANFSQAQRVVELEALLDAEKKKNGTLDQAGLGFKAQELGPDLDSFLDVDLNDPNVLSSFNLNTSTATTSTTSTSSYHSYHPYQPLPKRSRFAAQKVGFASDLDSSSSSRMSPNDWGQAYSSTEFRSLPVPSFGSNQESNNQPFHPMTPQESTLRNQSEDGAAGAPQNSLPQFGSNYT